MSSSTLHNKEALTPAKCGIPALSSDAVDVERASSSEGHPDGDIDGLPNRPSDRGPYSTPAHAVSKVESNLRYFETQLIKYNLEARGIQRVQHDECHTLTWKSYLQIYLMWFSINLAPNNFSLGMLAPTVFTLSFKDAAFCAVFGALLGSMGCGYIAIFGPFSGNRTLVKSPDPFRGWSLTYEGIDRC